MMRFEGKVVLVTGGGGAIGSAAVRRFIDEGARVSIAWDGWNGAIIGLAAYDVLTGGKRIISPPAS